MGWPGIHPLGREPLWKDLNRNKKQKHSTRYHVDALAAAPGADVTAGHQQVAEVASAICVHVIVTNRCSVHETEARTNCRIQNSDKI